MVRTFKASDGALKTPVEQYRILGFRCQLYCLKVLYENEIVDVQKKSLKNYSGLEFLNELKKIKCSMITIENNCVPKNWIKKKDLKDIFNKVLSRELCPGSAIMVRDFVLLCLILFDFGL